MANMESMGQVGETRPLGINNAGCDSCSGEGNGANCMVQAIAKSWSFAIIMFISVASWWALQVLPPALWWYDAKSMIASDAKLGEPVVMYVDREIKRPVFGEWDVILRRRFEDGWVIVCVAPGTSYYRPNSSMPRPLTLDWWTADQCRPDAPGLYFVSTIWTFDPAWLPGKRKTSPLVSNTFRIFQNEADK